MTNHYAWLPERDSFAFESSITEASATDIATVGELWVVTAYDDLRRAGPDRATQVRWILSRYVNPWFGPQTSTIGDVTYFMVHAWLMRLAGRHLVNTRAGGLGSGGVEKPLPGGKGWRSRFDDGSSVVFRPSSKSGSPAVEITVNTAKGDRYKIHFEH